MTVQRKPRGAPLEEVEQKLLLDFYKIHLRAQLEGGANVAPSALAAAASRDVAALTEEMGLYSSPTERILNRLRRAKRDIRGASLSREEALALEGEVTELFEELVSIIQECAARSADAGDWGQLQDLQQDTRD